MESEIKKVVMLPAKSHTLQLREEMQVDGSTIPMMILMADGVEKICPFAPIQFLQPAIAGGTPIIMRSPCNTRCGNFIVQHKDDNPEEPLFAVLKCGSGAFYQLTMQSVIKKIT